MPPGAWPGGRFVLLFSSIILYVRSVSACDSSQIGERDFRLTRGDRPRAKPRPTHGAKGLLLINDESSRARHLLTASYSHRRAAPAYTFSSFAKRVVRFLTLCYLRIQGEKQRAKRRWQLRWSSKLTRWATANSTSRAPLSPRTSSASNPNSTALFVMRVSTDRIARAARPLFHGLTPSLYRPR